MSLYQRGKSWYYDFQYRSERHTGCIGPVSKTIAKEILARKKAEAVEGRYELPSKKLSPRLEDFAKEYFAYYQTNRRPRSVKRHETSWHAIQPVLGSKRLAEISAFDLERHRRQRKQTGVSDVTINRELAFLRHLYTMAITWGKATGNPVKKVRFAREDNGRIRMLNPEEEGLLLAQCAPHLKPLIITALHTGFRASELLSLSWADIDFNRRVITVRAAYVKNGERRSIPMNDVLTATLQPVKMKVSEGNAVFRTPQGGPYRNFRTAFEYAVQPGRFRGLHVPRLAAYLCEPFGDGGGRLANCEGTARAQEHCDDAPLHAPVNRPQAACSACARAVWWKSPSKFHNSARTPQETNLLTC
jgi:integrase